MGSHYHEPPPIDDGAAVLAKSFELHAKIDEGGEPGKQFANLDDVRGLETRPPRPVVAVSFADLAYLPIEPTSQEADEEPTEEEWEASIKLYSDNLPRNRYKRGLPMFHREEMAELGEMIHSGRIQFWFVNHSSLYLFCSGLEFPTDHGTAFLTAPSRGSTTKTITTISFEPNTTHMLAITITGLSPSRVFRHRSSQSPHS